MSEKLKVLCIDDEPAIAFSFRNNLKEYDIDVFTSPLEALECYRQNFHDIILVDYKMPTMNGLEFLIEASKSNMPYHAILVSAYADKQVLEKFLNHTSISRYIDKPISWETLVSYLEELAQEIGKQKNTRRVLSSFRNATTRSVRAFFIPDLP